MSPDTVSSLFPDRPIRPLPKRRLRERLSPEVADSIKYPSSNHDNSTLFYYPPYTLKDEGHAPNVGSLSPTEQGRRHEPGRGHGSQREGRRPGDVDEEDTALRSTLVARSPPEILSRDSRRSSRPDHPRHVDPQPPHSATSSVDGYESFENTNNKKKRKIPSAGDSALGGTHALNNELSALALSGRSRSPVNEVHGDRSQTNPGAYTGSGSVMSASQGISGPGRGRLGRSRNGRSPLRTLSDGNNTWAGRASKTGTPQWAQTDHENRGIISSAIANAEKLPPQGQENVSLLQQHSSTSKATPTSTQFTFTCDSQVPGTVQWPGHSTRQNMGNTSQGVTGAATNGTANHDGSSTAASIDPEDARKKKQREDRKEFKAAARHRRRLASNNNYRNPPKAEDIWICEFCEYERIFGQPPRALTWEYERKDRSKRQEEADRKRLLEKAKAKSRKGRKGGKVPAKTASSMSQGAGQSSTEPTGDDAAPPMHPGHSHSTQSEEDYEDDFDDDYSNPAPDTVASVETGEGTSVSSREREKT